IIRGPLGSGKTTLAKKLSRKLKAEHVSFDSILKKKNLDIVNQKEGCIPVKNFIIANKFIIPIMNQKLEQGQIIIFDGCFYHKEVLENLIHNLPFPHYIFTLKTSLKVCIERDEKRKKTFGKEAAKSVYKLVSKFDYGISINITERYSDDIIKDILTYLPKTNKNANFSKHKNH
ncbi:MAG: ATP-binding protein, partial [Nanoarchaeota archaeon]|nr:ATP-binding protein [Nanoarchaeota archaeon]